MAAIVYMDYGLDGYMNSTDKVIKFVWSGSNQQYNSDLYNYVPSSPSGDFMQGSGFTLSGTINLNQTIESGIVGGSVAGTELETRVLWSTLGFSGQTPIKFKASSGMGSATNLPSQIEDNVGAVFSSENSYLLFKPISQAKPANNGTAVYYAHDVINCGNSLSRIELTNVSTQGWNATLYYPNGTTITDTNSDNRPDISLSESGYNIVVARLDVPSNAAVGTIDITNITAISSTSNKTVTDTTTVSSIAISPDSTIYTATQGMTASIIFTVYNYQSFNDTIRIGATSSRGWNITLTYANGTSLSNGNVGNLFSRESKEVRVSVFVSSNETSGANDLTTVRINSSVSALVFDTATINTTVRNRLIIAPNQSQAVGVDQTYFYLLNITNNWNDTERIEISKTSTFGFNTTFYLSDKVTQLTDTNGNNLVDVNVTAYGGVKSIYAAIFVPLNATLASSEVTTIFANSSTQSVFSFVQINQTVRGIQIYNDSALTNVKTTFNLDLTSNVSIFAKAFFLTGFNTVYFGWYSGNGSLFRQSPNVSVTENLNDSINININSSLGSWSVIIYNSSNNEEITRRTFTAKDSLAPRVYGLYPPAGTSFVVNNTINISANITDFGPIYIARANVSFPNGSSQLITLTNSQGDLYLESFTIPNLNGTYNVSYFVNDTFGFTNNTERTSFTATTSSGDTTPPSITNITTNPSLPLFNNGSQQNLITNFTSNEFPINITFRLYNSTGAIVNITGPTQVNNQSQLPVNFTIPTGLTNGNYTLNMSSVDNSGNTNISILGIIIVDTITPQITNVNTSPTLPLTNNGTAQNISVNFTSNEFPIDATFRLYNSSGSVVNITGPIRINSSSQLPVIFTVPTTLSNGDYPLNLTITDLAGNSNVTNAGTITINITTLTIVSINISPIALGIGQNVSLSMATRGSVSNCFVNVTQPNGTILTLTDPCTGIIFTAPNLTGRYNITFFANDTLGNIVNSSSRFEIAPPIPWRGNVVDNNLSGIQSTLILYFANTSIILDSHVNGTFIENTGEFLFDLAYSAHSNKLQVTLRNVNISVDNNKTIGLSRITTNSDFLVLYGVNNSYGFTGADVVVSYNGTSFTDESNLVVKACDDFNFVTSSCNSNFATISATQNTTAKTFTFARTSFSGFGISQSTSAASSVSSGGGGGSRIIKKTEEVEEEPAPAEKEIISEKIEKSIEEIKEEIAKEAVVPELEKPTQEIMEFSLFDRLKSFIPQFLMATLLLGILVSGVYGAILLYKHQREKHCRIEPADDKTTYVHEEFLVGANEALRIILVNPKDKRLQDYQAFLVKVCKNAVKNARNCLETNCTAPEEIKLEDNTCWISAKTFSRMVDFMAYNLLKENVEEIAEEVEPKVEEEKETMISEVEYDSSVGSNDLKELLLEPMQKPEQEEKEQIIESPQQNVVQIPAREQTVVKIDLGLKQLIPEVKEKTEMKERSEEEIEFYFNGEEPLESGMEAKAQEICKQRMEQGNNFRKGNVKWQENTYETVDDMIKAQGLQPGTPESGEFMKKWDLETVKSENHNA